MMKTTKKSVFICEKMLALTSRASVGDVGKITLLLSLILLLFSCIKLEENDKKYSARKLQKMLEGTWELTDYQIDGISYLDTFLKVNTDANCKNYTFEQWANSISSKGSNDKKTGTLSGDCQTQPSNGYEFIPRKKYLSVGWSYFRDSIYFFKSGGFDVLKLEDAKMLLTDENDGHIRKIYFKKQ